MSFHTSKGKERLACRLCTCMHGKQSTHARCICKVHTAALGAAPPSDDCSAGCMAYMLHQSTQAAFIIVRKVQPVINDCHITWATQALQQRYHLPADVISIAWVGQHAESR